MPNLPDFTTYDEDELEAARTAILAEQERRQRLASVPSEVAAMAQRYVEDGGDPEDLMAAVTLPVEQPEDEEPSSE